MIPEQVRTAARQHRYPLLFATVSGAHLYGFPSPDSDWDLRGAHIVPARKVVGLLPIEETVESTWNDDVEIDLVTHDVRKFFTLLLRPNGYVLEQLLSPLVVHSSPEHEELVQLAPACITRNHAHHYLGFADSEWKLFQKEQPPRVKPLLYLFRVLLTGIYLMLSGEIEANLRNLHQLYPLAFLPDLIALKTEGAEQQKLGSNDVAMYEGEFHRLREQLVHAGETSSLPDAPSAQPALHDLLIRVRLAS